MNFDLEKEAAEILPALGVHIGEEPTREYWVNKIAAFGRKCAAQALEEQVEFLSLKFQDQIGPGKPTRINAAIAWLRSRAASLKEEKP